MIPSDPNGNIAVNGVHMVLDTQNTLVYDHVAERLLVTIGVSDLVVVNTEDVLLVCHKSQAQEVRQIVQKLKEAGEQRYL